jgi:hypothetical protein
MIRFVHPANNLSFLALAANDAGVNGNPSIFGLRLGTALLRVAMSHLTSPVSFPRPRIAMLLISPTPYEIVCF